MTDRLLFEYAVVRIMPRVEREEFVNTGVVLFCAKQRFLQLKYKVDAPRILALCPKADVEEIRTYLMAFEQICLGKPGAGPIALLPLAGRFRWLTATRSTIVQTSKVHPGLCLDAAEMLDKIFEQQVL
ncbi:MAG: DUF3037 domain-containing protein [Bacteroidota bacterium]